MRRGSRFWLQPWRWPAAVVHAALLGGLLVWATMQCVDPLSAQGGLAAATHDRMQRIRLWASAPDPRLLVIDVDERSLAEMAPTFGRWPWPRDTLATVLTHAHAQGAAALVFDILFADPDRLHPGGDRALAQAINDAPIGVFPVTRLPAALDAHSTLGADRVPGLALPPPGAAPVPTVALIVPFMQAMVDSARLGTNSVTRDPDGVLRRFALAEPLPGGWRLRSLPAAVASGLGVATPAAGTGAQRIVWRDKAHAYPKVPFVELWACAEGGPRPGCPSLRGRILVLGSTATALHDRHATPMSSQHAGVDVLATLIDNALHGRAYAEPAPVLRWAACVGALLVSGALVRRGRAGATRRALVMLPPLLAALAWASLHSESVYLDLLLPAALALSHLSAVAAFDALRAFVYGASAAQAVGPHALVAGGAAAAGERLERAVFDLAARHDLRVTGGATAAGDGGAAHAVWALWGLDDAATARRLGAALQRAVPSCWHGDFTPGDDPPQRLHRAIAAAMPAAVPAAQPLNEPAHAS